LRVRWAAGARRWRLPEDVCSPSSWHSRNGGWLAALFAQIRHSFRRPAFRRRSWRSSSCRRCSWRRSWPVGCPASGSLTASARQTRRASNVALAL